MKKIASAFFALATLTIAAPVFAQTASSTFTLQISDLLKQIQGLNVQLQSLQQQKQQITTTLLTTLSQGSQGDKVKMLQMLLAADPTIYPEGLVTGFYGKATTGAVKRFQQKYGLPMVGNVGPKTLAKLSEFMRNQEVDFEDDNNGSTTISANTPNKEHDDKDKKDKEEKKHRLCLKIPPGNAFGWFKNHGENENNERKRLLPICNPTPAPSSTTDITTPTISNIASSIGSSTVNVLWTTNEAADAQIAYGVSSAYGAFTSLNSALVTAHSQLVAGLLPSTTYHFQILSRDAAHNLATSSDQTVTTLAFDNVAPVISSLIIAPSSTSAVITWTTNEPATTKIYYSLLNPIDINATSTVIQTNFTLATNHSVTLTGLNSTTTYYFIVESADALGNKSTSASSFVTLGL